MNRAEYGKSVPEWYAQDPKKFDGDHRPLGGVGIASALAAWWEHGAAARGWR